MHYQCLIISDSGAIEYTDRFLKNTKPSVSVLRRNAENDFQFEPPILEFEMYDDPEFNKLNDILHAPTNLIMNDRTKVIFESFKLPEHKYGKAKVSRVDNRILFLKSKREYQYHWLYFNAKAIDQLYDYIDFDRSDIKVYEGKNAVDIKIESFSHIGRLIESKRNYTWKANKIVLKNFDSDIDIFTLPFFSWMTYVSDRLRVKLQDEEISDIKFVSTGAKSRLEAVRNPILEIS